MNEESRGVDLKSDQSWYLEFYLAFLNCDLDHSSLGEQMKLAGELAIIMGCTDFSDIVESVSIDRVNQLLSNSGAELKRLQKLFKSWFELMTEKIRQASDRVVKLDGGRISKAKAHKLLKMFELRPEILMTVSLELESVSNFDADGPYIFDGVFDTAWKPEAVKEARFKVEVSAAKNENALLYHFVKALDKLPVSALVRCPECGAWFLHLSKRERVYCSNKCAATKTSRERYRRLREHDPESYQVELESGRERAHRAYGRKVKTEHPNAKVERRPRKRQDGEGR